MRTVDAFLGSNIKDGKKRTITAEDVRLTIWFDKENGLNLQLENLRNPGVAIGGSGGSGRPMSVTANVVGGAAGGLVKPYSTRPGPGGTTLIKRPAGLEDAVWSDDAALVEPRR